MRQQLEADARRTPGLRLLDGRFMVIAQAMGLSKRRGAQALALLAGFVDDIEAGGFVKASLERHRIEGATVAPRAQAAAVAPAIVSAVISYERSRAA